MEGVVVVGIADMDARIGCSLVEERAVMLLTCGRLRGRHDSGWVDYGKEKKG